MSERSAAPESRRVLAMTLMFLGMLVMPGVDAIAKGLSGHIASGQVTWSRFFFQTLLMLPLFLRSGGLGSPRSLTLHALRGALIALATLLFFTALKFLPMAETISIFFVEPLVLTLLSAWILGERVGWRQVAAVLAGFAGALMIIRPSFADQGLVAFLPLGAAVSFAFYLLLTRWVAQRETPERMQLFSGLFAMLGMTAALSIGHAGGIEVLSVVAPSSREWLLLATLGAIAAVGHLLVVHAFRRAPANVLAPFRYVEILGATLLGYLVFGDFPDRLAWMGVAIIVGSGLYVFRREAAGAPLAPT